MLQRTPSTFLALGIAALALALTGCTSPEPAPTPKPSVTATVEPSGDGALRLGTLFPMTGGSAASGAAQVAGTELAGRDIAQEGLVLGAPVLLIHRNSAGDVDAALADLVARGVDAVLWDATTAVPEEVEAAAAESGLAVLALADFVNGGTPLAAGEAFSSRLRTADPGLVDTAGGVEGYDAVVLTALAATRMEDDGSASLQAGWAAVREGPTVCTSWGECVAALADSQQIDFQGISGAQS